MFSYRHAFHAGNHADVLKHVVLIQLLRYLNQKDKPYMAIDTHAGAGVYTLDGTHASKSGESETGIARLWDRDDLPAIVADYVDLVKSLNPSGKMRYYPGSPYCAEKLLREQDRLRLFELHSTDSRLLDENFRKLAAHVAEQGQRDSVRGKRVMVQKSDGFLGLKALLPPPSRRGLVLIDPPYEDKRDYRHVQDAMTEALKRFSTGIYAVWYPVLQRPESRRLPDNLKRLSPDWLNVTLTVGGPTPDGYGLRSSGMFVFNPPWTLRSSLQATMPWLTGVLAQDDGAHFSLEAGSAG